MTLQGGCLCNGVRYEIEGAPKFIGVCHCKHCQKQSGAAFSVNLGVSGSKLSITGEIKEYQDTANSGAVLTRRFCPNCGSALFSVSSAAPNLVYVKAGTLDDTSDVKPMLHVWTESAQSWVHIGDEVTQFRQQPAAA